MLIEKKYISDSVLKTQEIALDFIRSIPLGSCVVLRGEMGAGKTAFVKGASKAFGIDPDTVLSPTFVLHRCHIGQNAIINHCDLYRLESASEVKEAGIVDLIGKEDAVLFVEWADVVLPYLPKNYYEVEILNLPDKEDAREIYIRKTEGKD